MAMRRLQLRIKGFVEPRRCFCSDPPPPPSSSSNKDSKETTAAKEESAVDSKSFINRFMLSHPVVSSEITEVQEKLGKSWYTLKDILTEMKSKVLPTSQINKQVVVEATVMEGNWNNDELDGPEKESVPFAGMLNVEKSHTTGIKDPKNLPLDKISDNAQLPKPKQMEHAMEMLHVEKPLNTEAKGKKDLLLANICDNTELTECKQVKQSVEMLDMGESHRWVKGSEDLYLVKISDNAELPEPKQTELSMEALALSTAGLGQQLSNISQSTRYVVKEEESTRVSFSDVHSSDLKLTKTNSYEREETDSPSAKENFPDAETAAYEKEGIYLFDFCNREINKGKELTRPKIDALKHETSELKDNSHVISLVDIFKKNQKFSGDKLINEKKLERDGTLNMKEPETQGLINRIFEVSNKAEKTGSLDEIFKLPSLNKEQSCGVHRDKAKVRKADVQKIRSNKLHGENSTNLAANNDRGEEKQTGKNEVGNRNSKLSKNEKAMDSSEESDSDVAASDYPEPESSDLIHLISQRLDSDATPNDQMSGFEHCLLVKFLCKTTKVNDLSVAFGDCGPISDIRIVNSGSENRFNYAYICFKTEEGLKRAADKQDVAICSTDVVFEPASSLKAYNKVFNAESIGDLDFPIAFLKNPSRTIVVKGLPEDVSFHYLKGALSIWGHVSGFAMGSSPSNAYVEFKSEETKERVLAEGTVSVSGKKLSVLRVDAPKTTVVRISNVNPHCKLAKILSICGSYGQVKRLVKRDGNIFDVHFSSSEWANMVKILNRLNGLVVDQHQWIAQPATVIPAKMLQDLWSKPEGREHVHEMIQTICKRIEANSIDTAPMLDLAHKYYVDS